jgi:hypothetical protein
LLLDIALRVRGEELNTLFLTVCGQVTVGGHATAGSLQNGEVADGEPEIRPEKTLVVRVRRNMDYRGRAETLAEASCSQLQPDGRPTTAAVA